MSEELKNKLFWGASTLGYLALSYRLVRYTFFEMHGMIQLPNVLAIISAIIIIIVSLLGKKISALASVAAYIGGFGLAMLFNADGVDPGGATTNNGWIIWIVAYAIILLGGFILDYTLNKRRINNAL